MDKSRPVRNRRNSRKTWAHDSHRPAKRLFTPEIKRMLKDWLVRRRENPYPSRDEKKALAVKTGLTYIQICNWFANWRRKLKNTGSNRKKTWGNLIKNYNYSAKGNVEQFSISSRDSIWEEELEHEAHLLSKSSSNSAMSTQDQDYNTYYNQNASSHQYENDIGDQKIILPLSCSSTPPELLSTQCFQITSTNGDIHFQHFPEELDVGKNEAFKNYGYFMHSNKYKSHIMEKYLRGLDDSTNSDLKNLGKPELTKWIESAQNFTPSKASYIDWEGNPNSSDKNKRNGKMDQTYFVIPQHEKDELDAAEALTRLASNFKNRGFSQRPSEKNQHF